MNSARCYGLAALTAGLVFLNGIPTAWALPPKTCDRAPTPDQRIASCTAFLSRNISAADRAYALQWRANAFTDKFQYNRAISDLTEGMRVARAIPRANPTVYIANSHNSRGLAFAYKGDYASAIKDYDAAIRLRPRFTLALANRALAYEERRQFALALRDYDAAVKSNPRYAVAFNNRSNVHRELGNIAKAIADATQAIHLDPKMGLAYQSRSRHYLAQGDIARAQADIDQAVKLQRPRAGLGHAQEWSLFYRADIHRAMGHLPLALADCERMQAIEADYIPTLLCFGKTYEKMGDAAQARTWYERAIASRNQRRTEATSRKAMEDAEARLAAIASGEPPPAAWPAAKIPVKATSIPTSAVSARIVTEPLARERLEATVRQGRRIALVIGNSAYRSVSTLPNPKNDATAMAAALRNMGFASVTLALDATRESMVDHLRRFASEAETADWAMIYFSGHGVEVQGQNYLIPIDAKLDADRDARFEAVQLDQVMGTMEGAKKLRLVILDACRDNPFEKDMRRVAAPLAPTVRGAVNVAQGLGEVMVSGASLIVFAAKHGQTALDGDGENSPFTTALVQRIATPGVEINKIFRLVRDDVLEATGGRQEPYTYGSLPGREDFFFVAAR